MGAATPYHQHLLPPATTTKQPNGRTDQPRATRTGLTVLPTQSRVADARPVASPAQRVHDAFRRRLRQAWRSGMPPSSPSAPTCSMDRREEASRMRPRKTPADMACPQTVTSAVALIDVMLDSERIEPGPTTDWAGSNQRFSDWLDGEERDSHRSESASMHSPPRTFRKRDLGGGPTPRASIPKENFDSGWSTKGTETIRGLRRLAYSARCFRIGTVTLEPRGGPTISRTWSTSPALQDMRISWSANATWAACWGKDSNAWGCDRTYSHGSATPCQPSSLLSPSSDRCGPAVTTAPIGCDCVLPGSTPIRDEGVRSLRGWRRGWG